MESLPLAALNGLALGLASTLHCAGMCGAISCSVLMAPSHETPAAARQAFALTHIGRILAYALAGAAAGLMGAPALDFLDRDVAFRLLQWAGAAALTWIGLSTAGLLPSISILDRPLAALSGILARASRPSPHAAFAPLVAGLTWGLMPCAMVYGALFLAMLSGSAYSGAAVMLAFGIGTLPGLVVTSFGIRAVSRTTGGRALRTSAGLAIAVFGIATLIVTHPQADGVCTPQTVSAQPAAGLSPINWTR